MGDIIIAATILVVGYILDFGITALVNELRELRFAIERQK